eukprot:TRINITY_DN15683_c0_g1_i1.p1 TRINITY_DN15683_c0_g1~~TRINITY_DN15683_c0_g1_i1.p1  ORF type:complete len:654 (+),score=88.88 TRINITY_DN15683_c0_g1_i1:236-2197(+)
MARVGAAYGDFHRCCTDYFESLKLHGIPMVVVLDGVSGEEKLATQISRERKRVEFVENLLRGPRRIQVSEVLAPIMFQQMLTDALEQAGVDMFVAIGEADKVIWETAVRRGWQVLSNDSDFAIYQSAGWIPLDSFRVGIEHLEYGVVSPKDLADSLLGGDAGMLALFGTLAGNDYTGHLPELARWHAGLSPNRSEIPVKVAGWLRGLNAQSPNQDLTDKILDMVAPGNKGGGLREAIRFSVREYTVESSGELGDDWKMHDGRDVPEWLKIAHTRGRLGMGSQLAMKSEFWCASLAESCRDESCWRSSTSIRLAACSLLYPQGGTVVEWCRKDRSPLFCSRRIGFHPADDIGLPDLESLAQMGQGDRQGVLLDTMLQGGPTRNVVEKMRSDGLPEELDLLVLGLVHVARRWEPKQSHKLIQNISLMVATQFISSQIPGPHEPPTDTSSSERPSWWRGEVHVAAVHRFSELHATLASAHALNAVLMEPFRPVSPWLLLNGLTSWEIMAHRQNSDDGEAKELAGSMVNIVKWLMDPGSPGEEQLPSLGQVLPAGSEWRGEASYDGDMDQYSLTVIDSPSPDHPGSGVHSLYGQEEPVRLVLAVQPKTSMCSLKIEDGDSRFGGWFDRSLRTVQGKCFSMEEDTLTEEGTFWLKRIN